VIIYSVLIYIVSLAPQSAMDVTINNRCDNIGLASSACFTKDVTRHIQFPQQVDSRSIMRVNFVTGVDRETFGGALLYQLQRKTNTTVITQLLVIWGYSIHGFYSRALLIEHESILTWNEDKLKKLHHVYNNQYAAYLDFGRSTLLLDDNTKLQIGTETSRGDFKIEVVISEEGRLFYPRKPQWVDSNR
jgi:hypothetical protein